MEQLQTLKPAQTQFHRWCWPPLVNQKKFHDFVSSNVRWRFSQLLFVILHQLDLYAETSEFDLSRAQERCLLACLQLAVQLGVLSYLNPDIGLDTSLSLTKSYHLQVRYPLVCFFFQYKRSVQCS